MRPTVAIILVTLVTNADARAQRRGEEASAASSLLLTLDNDYRFGDVEVRAGQYRVSIRGTSLGLADATTMVPVATVPVSEAETGGWVEPARLQVSRHGQKVTIRVHIHDRLYELQGTQTRVAPREKPDVTLAGKQDVELGYQGPRRETVLDQIARVMKRYEKGIKHCADKAQRGRWETDDPRFVKCVCPATSKWRMPKTAEPTRYHHLLGKRRTGMSFTVTAEGKVEGCRVWSGSQPPADERAPTKKGDGEKPR